MALLQPLEGRCPRGALAAFSEAMGSLIFRVNALVLTNALLVGVLVVIGAYHRRYRHHPVARYIFRGAAILFLPIISYVVSSTSNQYIISLPFEGEILTARCSPLDHIFLVLVWTGLVQVVGINYTTAVVAADSREAGRREAPPVLSLVYAFWTGYLAVYTAGRAGYTRGFYFPEFVKSTLTLRGLLVVLLFALIFAKMVLMYYAFYMARKSYALGRNPRLIVGYMKQLDKERTRSPPAEADHHTPPPLIVTGEDAVHVEKHPHGALYYPHRQGAGTGRRTDTNKRGLLTIDKVCQLPEMPDQRLKDVCFSFALFKLLRCRFARYSISKANCAEVHSFIWNEFLFKDPIQKIEGRDGDGDSSQENKDERVLGVIVDELSFLYDYYYSSHPIFHSECWLHIFGILMSVLSIGYCLLVAALQIWTINTKQFWLWPQIACHFQLQCMRRGSSIYKGYGNFVFDLLPVFILLGLVILSEIKDVATYIYSNWTKVTLIGRYVSHPSWGQSPTRQMWVGHVLQRRCNKLLKNWANRMNQCSVLELRRSKTPMALLRCLFPRLPEQRHHVEVQREVKSAVVDALRSRWQQLRGAIPPFPPTVQIQIGGNILLGCITESTTDTILVCHIATSILEVRHPNSASHKVVATHLSKYFAYLVAYTPELLPDDKKWSRSYYRDVKKDAKRALVGRAAVSTPEQEYEQLVKLLGEESNHDHGVLKNGAMLVEQLPSSAMAAWEVLACFWLDMLLYVAPSDNLDGHAEAVARGGELITLLWALLGHVGVVGRPDFDDIAAISPGIV